MIDARRAHHWIITVGCAFAVSCPLVLFSVGCDSGTPDVPGGESGPPAPGEVVYDVEYKPGVEVVGGTAVMSADTAAHEYVLAGGAELATGDIVLLEGYDLGRVATLDEGSGGVRVTLDPVPLDAAIESGRVGWNLDFEFTQESVGRMTVDGHAGRWNASSDTAQWHYESGDFTIDIKIVPHGDYADILTQVVKGEENALTARINGEGRVNGIHSLVDAVYGSGELEEFTFESTDLSGEMDLTLVTAASGSVPFDFTMPEFAVQWPIPPNVMPIPSTIGVGVQFVASFSVGALAQASVTTGLSFSGDAGFEFEGAEVAPLVSFQDPGYDPSEADASASIGVEVDAQAGVAFPRVTLNVLNNEIAYLLAGMTAGSKLTWGPICKSAYTRLLVQGGYKLAVMGITLAEDEVILFDRQRTGSQNDCADDGGSRPEPLFSAGS